MVIVSLLEMLNRIVTLYFKEVRKFIYIYIEALLYLAKQ